MPTWRRTLLESLPAFYWAPREEKWEKQLDCLSTFLKERGALPRRRSPDSAERSLANWFAHQRRRYSAGNLPHHQLIQLNSILSSNFPEVFHRSQNGPQ